MVACDARRLEPLWAEPTERRAVDRSSGRVSCSALLGRAHREPQSPGMNGSKPAPCSSRTRKGRAVDRTACLDSDGERPNLAGVERR